MISRVIVGSACCCLSSTWMGGSAIWLSLPNPTSSFALPAPKSSPAAARRSSLISPSISHPTTRASSARASRSRQHYARDFDRLLTLNVTDWADPWQPAASYTPSILPVETDISTALLQQHLLEGLIAHQSLLDSMDLQPAFERNRQNDEPHIATVPHSSSPPTTPLISILSDVWKARLLLLLSAALYGTNFTIVKSIDEIG